MAWFRHDRSEKKRSHVFSMGAARPLAPEFREVPSPQPHVQIWSRDQAHLPPLYLYTLWVYRLVSHVRLDGFHDLLCIMHIVYRIARYFNMGELDSIYL